MKLAQRARAFTGLLAVTALAACNRYEYRELCAPPPPRPVGSIAWEQADLPPGTIAGRIISLHTGELTPAVVMLQPGRSPGVTNDGLFRVDSLPPGQYTLSVRFIGFMGASQQITLDGTKGVSVLAVLARDYIMLDGCGSEKVRKPWWRFE